MGRGKQAGAPLSGKVWRQKAAGPRAPTNKKERSFTMDRINVNNFDVSAFSEVLASCKGDVYMVTPEGDRLNLKSKLCQMLGFTSLIKGGQIASAQFECTDPEDESRLFRFNLFGEK